MPYVTYAIRTAFFAAAVTATTSSAFATPPGERVKNTVTVSFAVDSVVQDSGVAEVGFVVDRKIDMLVADTASIVDGRPKQEGRTLVYKVTNEGNDTQAYDIDVVATGVLEAKLTLDSTANPLTDGKYRVYISTDGTVANGTVYDPANLSVAATPLAFDGATADDEFFVVIEVNIPANAEDTETVVFHVKATALDGTAALVESTGNGLDDADNPASKIDVVFADGAKTADSNGADIAEDGKHTDNASLTVASAKLTVSKTVTIVSENTQSDFLCASEVDPGINDTLQGAIPGACLEYTITVANGAASEAAENVTIVDPLPGGVTFASFFDNTDWPNAVYDGGQNEIEASLLTLAPNQTRDLVFRVVVD